MQVGVDHIKMAILNAMKYEAPIGELSPEYVLTVLRDVQKGLEKVDENYSRSLTDVLGVVESGGFIAGPTNAIRTHVNLVAAQTLISQYRAVSEQQGCENCMLLDSHKLGPDETGKYCEPFERPEDIDEKIGMSPRYTEFREGEVKCPDRIPVFEKTIEQLLVGAK